MLASFKEKLFIKNTLDFGEKTFLLGVFFFPSALPIGAIFLLLSLVISFKESYRNIFKDKFNYITLICIGLILISTINICFVNIPNELRDYQKSLILVNLFNWIPILLGFIGFQIYLKTSSQRIYFTKFLIVGTTPIILSCFLQVIGIEGPLKTLYGSIVWFLKPYLETGGITGLFSNPNYLSFWLVTTLPLYLNFTKSITYKKNFYKKVILGGLSILIIIFCFLTNSRNAFLGIFIIFWNSLGFRKSILAIITSSFFGIIYLVSPLSTNFSFTLIQELKVILTNINLNNTVVSKLSYILDSILLSPRIQIWKTSITLISENPISGWGASTFPYLNKLHNSKIFPPIDFIDAQHTHNILLELSHNFGVPLSLIISGGILTLIIRNFLRVKENLLYPKSLLDRTWLLSSFLIVLLQMTDITYYDGKVSLLICIFFAGLRCMLNNDIKENLS